MSAWCHTVLVVCFFFNDTATTEIYTYLHTLSLHDALPICAGGLFPFARRSGGQGAIVHVPALCPTRQTGSPSQTSRAQRPSHSRSAISSATLALAASNSIRLARPPPSSSNKRPKLVLREAAGIADRKRAV